MDAIKLVAGQADHGAMFILQDHENPHVGASLKLDYIRISGKYSEFDASYMHFEEMQAPDREPTENERTILAKFWLGDATEKHRILRTNTVTEAIFRSGPGLGQDVCEWVLGGLTPDQVSAKYGSGKKVFLA